MKNDSKSKGLKKFTIEDIVKLKGLPFTRVYEGKEEKTEDGGTATFVRVVRKGFRTVDGLVLIPAENDNETVDEPALTGT